MQYKHGNIDFTQQFGQYMAANEAEDNTAKNKVVTVTMVDCCIDSVQHRMQKKQGVKSISLVSATENSRAATDESCHNINQEAQQDVRQPIDNFSPDSEYNSEENKLVLDIDRNQRIAESRSNV